MRIDNTDKEVIEYYRIEEFDDNDPASTIPIDLCFECGIDWARQLIIENPDYTDNNYTCFECCAKLKEETDGINAYFDWARD